MTVIIKTKRLILRTVELADAKSSFAIYSDPEVMKWLDGETPFATIDLARASIERGIDCQRKHGVSHWAVILQSNNQMIGHCGFHPFAPEANVLELVVHLNRRYWGFGFATEAARAACEHAFDSCSAERIIALAIPENLQSQKVLRKIGFAQKSKAELESVAKGELTGLLFFELSPTDRTIEAPD